METPKTEMSNDQVPVVEKDICDNVTIIESVCVQCLENGETHLLTMDIPYFKAILVSSFYCPHCNFRNNEVQQIGDIQPFGCIISLKCETADDLDRQVIKSEHGAISIPELEFEIPSTTQKGICSTVQGMLVQAMEGLKADQDYRKEACPEVYEQIEAFLVRYEDTITLKNGPFSFVIRDPSGNSHIENPNAPFKDPKLVYGKFARTEEELHAMGYYGEQSEPAGADLPEGMKAAQPATWDLSQPLGDDINQNHCTFVFPCAHCGHNGNQNMCEIDIPGFRKCWVMSFVCDQCGAKSSEVKPSGAYGDQCAKWTLTVKDEEDLCRDILKSDCAGLTFPALDMELEAGTLGGVFTTVEGLLRKIKEEIENKFPFAGDSQLAERRQKIDTIVSNLESWANGENLPFEMVLEDPADHSHIGRRGAQILFLTGEESSAQKAAHDTIDEGLTVVKYDRTFDQNEELGLNDMKVENYC